MRCQRLLIGRLIDGDELVKLGYRFKTSSDTEVIIKLYEEYKEDCLNKLNGQFAFAIWDKEKEELFLARDRVGIRPLYYYYNSLGFSQHVAFDR